MQLVYELTFQKGNSSRCYCDQTEQEVWVSKQRSGQLISFILLNVSLFPVALPQRPTSVQIQVNLPLICCSQDAECRCLNLNKYICLWMCVCDSKFPFFLCAIYKNEFFVKLTPSVCSPFLSAYFGLYNFPSCFFCKPFFYRATALILYYTAYLLRPCVYIETSTHFLLTLEAQLASKNYSFSGQFCRTDHCLV